MAASLYCLVGQMPWHCGPNLAHRPESDSFAVALFRGFSKFCCFHDLLFIARFYEILRVMESQLLFKFPSHTNICMMISSSQKETPISWTGCQKQRPWEENDHFFYLLVSLLYLSPSTPFTLSSLLAYCCGRGPQTNYKLYLLYL